LASQVAIDPDIARTLPAAGKAGEDERDVSGPRNHRVIPVGVALTAAVRVHMDAGDDGQGSRLAQRPQLAEVPAREANDARRQTVRIQVVVEHEIDDAGTTVLACPQQERTALARAVVSPLAKPGAQPTPDQP